MAEAASRPDYRSAPRLLSRYIGNRWLKMAMAIVLGICAGACEVIPAWAVWKLVVSMASHEAQVTDFVSAAVIYVLAVVGKALFFGGSTALAHLIAFGVIADIRKALGRTWNDMAVGKLAKVHSSQAKTVALDHCEKLELFIAHAVPEAAAALTVWLSVTLWLFVVDWRLALATVALVPVAFLTMVHAMRSNGHRMGDWVQANGAMGAAIVDFIVAMPVIRVFNRVNEDHRRTTDAVRRNADLQSDWGSSFVKWGALFSTLVATSIAVIAPIGAWLYSTGRVEPATLLLFLIIGPTYPVPLVTLFYRLVALPMLSHGAVEIENQLALSKNPDDEPQNLLTPTPSTCNHAGEQPVEQASQSAEVRFENVHFAYEPGIDVLHDISFRAAPGTITALVGVSGSGKSTIRELVLGFHRARAGQIFIGGREIGQLSDAELSAQVSAVFQRPYLLAGSIRDNLVLGDPDVGDEQLHQAMRAAAVDRFADALPDGIDTQLGESGSGLSGGERQRVSIARALVENRPVLILDEATAATDPDNEALIQQGLAALTEGRTVIVIAHRLGTIKHADCIHVLDSGRIVESGMHEELLAANGEYASLWRSQSEGK